MLPIPVDPVKLTFLTGGCLHSASDTAGVFLKDVVTTLNTPGSNPARLARCASASVVNGVSGDGFAIMVQPAASAAPTFLNIILSSS